jgi:AcrR family transcriptional regulator
MRKPRFAHRSRAVREAEILDAALAAFANSGCFRMTLDEVATRVGIAKGTLYLHYASREALLTAVLARAGERLRERCWNAWKGAPSAVLGLRAVLAGLVTLNREPDGISPVVLSRLQCGLSWMQRVPSLGWVEGALEPVVTAWQEARLIDAGLDARWVAQVSLALAAASADGPAEVAAERIATLLLRGLPPQHGT